MVLARTYSLKGSKERNLLRRSNAKEKTVIADFDCMQFVLSNIKVRRVNLRHHPISFQIQLSEGYHKRPKFIIRFFYSVVMTLVVDLLILLIFLIVESS